LVDSRVGLMAVGRTFESEPRYCVVFDGQCESARLPKWTDVSRNAARVVSRLFSHSLAKMPQVGLERPWAAAMFRFRT
jgi:hypothetical protein